MERTSLFKAGKKNSPANTGKARERFWEKMRVNGPEGWKLARKNSLAAGVACMAIYTPVPGLKGRTLELWDLNRWVLNFCIRSAPLRDTFGVLVS